MAAIEKTSKKILAIAGKYTKIVSLYVEDMSDKEILDFCDDIRSMAMSLITQAPDKDESGILVLDICCDASDRLAARTYANSIAHKDPEKSMGILKKIQDHEDTLDGGTVKPIAK